MGYEHIQRSILSQLPLFGGITCAGLVLALLLVKPLNLLLLGDGYARNLGVNLSRVRNLLLLATGLLTAAITAFCGPVSFIGLAVPHIARLIFRTDDHRTLMPATILMGGGVTLCCNLLCTSCQFNSPCKCRDSYNRCPGRNLILLRGRKRA